MDKTNQTPLRDTSRTRCLTWTFGAGGVSPIFSSRFEYFVHLRYISQTSRLEISDSPKISFLKLMCFYSLKIYISIFDHPNPTFFLKKHCNTIRTCQLSILFRGFDMPTSDAINSIFDFDLSILIFTLINSSALAFSNVNFLDAT